eukprot:gene11091-3798_t
MSEEENFIKLKASNFPSSLDTDEVEEYFENFKPKSCKVILHPNLFAILEFEKNEEGKKKIETDSQPNKFQKKDSKDTGFQKRNNSDHKTFEKPNFQRERSHSRDLGENQNFEKSTLNSRTNRNYSSNSIDHSPNRSKYQPTGNVNSRDYERKTENFSKERNYQSSRETSPNRYNDRIGSYNQTRTYNYRDISPEEKRNRRNIEHSSDQNYSLFSMSSVVNEKRNAGKSDSKVNSNETNDFLDAIVGNGNKNHSIVNVAQQKKDDDIYIVVMAFKSKENFQKVKNLLPKNE